MQIVNSLGKALFKQRIGQIDHFRTHPEEVQQKNLQYLLRQAVKTEYGRKYDFSSIKSLSDFSQRVPLTSYEDLLPFINRMLKGEQNILWPTPVKCFAKSSGTTGDSSKLVPVTRESLINSHFQGGRDMIALYLQNYPDSKMFLGKNLSIGGNQESRRSNVDPDVYIGNISAIVMKYLPFWAQYKRTPGLDVTMMESWEEKIKMMASITPRENVTSMAGSPMWLILLLQQIFNEKKVNYLKDVWPNLEVFFHGSVSFLPYKPLFDLMDSDGSMRYQEVYNATEGFFGLQDRQDDPSLLLMLNYQIYYEFIAEEDFLSEQPATKTLEEVELHKNYSMVISTSSGLWRYKIGDTIRFTEKNPYRFIISGRTKNCINIFGEDLFVEHAEKAMIDACAKTGAILENFSAAPRFYDNKNKGCHEWVVEFIKEPENLTTFSSYLDNELCRLNDDYKSKRAGNSAITEPVVHSVATGTFYGWLKKNHKLGGQHKIPRLSNKRDLIEELLQNNSRDTSCAL
ncbi:MAG TPA: GH3 auxin-responsive promoter family protein [Gillisia sp.]|nr:GH3 auxin-responsive promoter family protein [Gillisia sp.]